VLGFDPRRITQRRAFLAANLKFPNTLAADSPFVKQFAVGNTGTSGGGGLLRRLDSSLRIPESYQANVGFERELSKSFVVEVNYTWNRNLHLWREFNTNRPVVPKNFKNFTDYLASRDFANFLSAAGGVRPQARKPGSARTNAPAPRAKAPFRRPSS